MGYEFRLADAGIIPVVLVIVQYLKKYVNKRWVPLLPFLVSAGLTGLSVIAAYDGWPGWPVFIAETTLETLKIAFTSMGLYKIYWTTILGK